MSNKEYDRLQYSMERNDKKTVFECVEGHIPLRYDQVLYIESFRHKNTIHTASEEYHIYESMDTLEQKLQSAGFIRIHRCFIVNIDHVVNINNYMIILDNEVRLPVAKARYKKIKEKILGH